MAGSGRRTLLSAPQLVPSRPRRMSLPLDPESLLRDHLGYVERACASLCRRHGLHGDDADDFAGWARMRLVEDDYAAIRKFRGESAFTTYLTVVLAMLFRDYRVALWGRWRPSAAARRLGELAVRLETLVHREGYRLEQAGERLRSAGETDLSDRALAELLARLPPRQPLRPVPAGEAALERLSAREGADGAVLADEAERERRAATEALLRAVEGLPAEERVIVRMRVWEELSVADIARALSVPQKPLYRRLERIFSRLRGDVERAGVTRGDVRRMLDEWAA